MGMQSDASLSDRILEFSPDVIIANSKGRKIQGIKIAQKIRRPKGLPKVILLNSPTGRVTEQEAKDHKIDAVIESPIQPRELLRTLARVAGIVESLLLEKLDKLSLFETSPEKQSLNMIPGKAKMSEPIFRIREREKKEGSEESLRRKLVDARSHAQRVESQKRALENLSNPPVKTISKQIVNDIVNEIRAEGSDREEREIDEERKAFTRELFTQGKKN